jgi:hypothetical protein
MSSQIEVKLAQPRHVQQQRQREAADGGDPAYGSGGAFRMNNNFGGTNGTAGGTGAVQTGATGGAAPPAFDAQAMANLYQRMMSVAQQGGMMGMGMGMPMMPGMMGMPMMNGMGRGMGMPNAGMNGMSAMNPMMGGVRFPLVMVIICH